MRKLSIQLLLVGGLAWGGIFLPSPVYAQQTLVDITAPAVGEVVSGVVQISGTAIDADFAHYELAYALDPPITEESWIPIQPPITQQVRDGILGAWDTTPLVDGRYLIRLRVVRNDEEAAAVEEVVRVQVSNATATPLPTLPPAPSATPLPDTPTPGPSPTPLIQQPPTRTPRPTPTPGGPTSTPEPLNLEDSPFRPDRLRQAAVRGGLITLGAFCLLGLYLLFRNRLLDEIRVLVWQIRQRQDRD